MPETEPERVEQFLFVSAEDIEAAKKVIILKNTKNTCTMMRGWIKGTVTVSILQIPWHSLSSFHTP